MGAGVALAIKTKWPKVYEEYLKVPIGPDMLGSIQPVELDEDLYVVNCFTQEYYGRTGGPYANPKWIYSCLKQICFRAEKLSLPVYMPKIGCNLGGLDWEKDVKPVMEHISSNFEEVQIYVCSL